MTTINAQTIINEVMAAHAIAPIKKDADFFSKIKIKTSDRGFHTILNCKENLQRFADLVRKNAAAFGGGIVREAKQKPAISWPANLISLFKQSIEDHDYQAALDIGDKLGALFFIDNKGHALMQVAPVPCEFEARLSSVCNENGTYAVIFPQNMTFASGSSFKAKRSRQSQIDNVQTALNARTNFNLSEALDKESFAPVDQAATRAQWIAEHDLSAEVIESRIVAHETESIEAMAAQDVAQVVAQAVAAAAISEAMQPSEADAELVTCEAESASTVPAWVASMQAGSVEKLGSYTPAFTPVPQYVPCPPDKNGFNDGPAPAFRGNDGDTPTPPPAEFLGDAIPPVTISAGQNKDRLMALINSKEDERARMDAAKSEAEKQSRALIIAQIEKEIQGEYRFLGMPQSAELAQIDDDALLEAIAEHTAPVAAFTPPVVETPDTLESFYDTGEGVSDALYEAVQNATIAQVQALTDAQFSKLYDHLENWNFHAENIRLQALRTGVQSLIDEIAEVIRLKDDTGCGLSGPLYDRYITACRAVWDYKPTDPKAKQAQDVPALETPKGQQVIGKSGKWSAYLYTWHDGKPWMTFEATSGAYECNGYDNARERMKALQALAKAADAPTDTPPGGGLPCPEPVAVVEPVAGVAPTPTVAVSSASPTPRVAVSSDFERVGNVRVDLADMVARGAKPESLIGLGVYYKGNMANPSCSGAITATGNSEWYGLIVDVTLESGIVWRAIRASEFKDGSFSLDAKLHGAPYMAELAARVAAIKANASASKEIAATAHAKALADLAAQYPQLKRAENTYAGGKLAAANMRILLKAAFSGCKFSVTSDYKSVRVNWTDGPSDKQVNEVVGRFDIGASDSQSDYFYTVSTAFSQLFGGVQYLTTRREVSDSLVQVAIDRLYSDRSEKPTVADYRKCTGVFDWNSQNYENRRMREMLETLGK